MKSTVCLIVRNEALYLAEWVAHYMALGFDEIVIYENSSTDNTAEILSRLSQAGYIVYRPWPLGADSSPQISAYKDAFKQLKSEWIFFADADELLVLKQHETVNAFLKRFDNCPEVTTIAVNWRLFGDSHLQAYDDRLMRERFIWAAKGGDRIIKSFTRVKALSGIVDMHICETSGLKVHPSGIAFEMPVWGRSDVSEIEVAQVNHYYIKTWSEYLDKRRRGYADVGESDERKYNMYSDELFHKANRNEVIDTSIDTHRDAFDRVYPKVKAIIETDVPKSLWYRLARRLTGAK